MFVCQSRDYPASDIVYSGLLNSTRVIPLSVFCKWKNKMWSIHVMPFLLADLTVQCSETMDSCNAYHIKQEHDQGKRCLDTSTWAIKPEVALDIPAFGLVSYKLGGPFWASALPSDKQNASSLANSAQSWLKQRGVKHPDFDFFTTRQ